MCSNKLRNIRTNVIKMREAIWYLRRRINFYNDFYNDLQLEEFDDVIKSLSNGKISAED